MSTKSQIIIDTLTQGDYDTVTEMASQNFAPSDIALSLGVSKKIFLHIWRDTNSLLREAYERGLLEIQKTKQIALLEMMKNDNVTAYQIHDKEAKEQAFKDVVNDVFNG